MDVPIAQVKNITINNYLNKWKDQGRTTVIGISRTLSGPYFSNRPFDIYREKNHKPFKQRLWDLKAQRQGNIMDIADLVCTLIFPDLHLKK